MSEREKLRDAVVEAARETTEVMRTIGMRVLPPDFNDALEHQDYAVRALDAAERPRFRTVAIRPDGDARYVFREHDAIGQEFAKCGTADGAALIARLLNEHFEKAGR